VTALLKENATIQNWNELASAQGKDHNVSTLKAVANMPKRESTENHTQQSETKIDSYGSEQAQQDISRLESEVRGYVRLFPTVFNKAKGSILTDTDGKDYIDFFCGAGTLNYGHNNPKAKLALIDYIQGDGIQHSLDTATKAKVEFLRAFEEIILKPRQLDYKIQFTGPTGTNAVEAAIKLARKTKQRSHVIAFSHAYHGHTLGALALTGNDYYHDDHYGSRSNVSHLPYDGYMGDNIDTSEYLDKVLDDQSSGIPIPAAIILETVQGEGGINVASNSWLQNIAAICKKHDILLIVDDIQMGNGRTGKFFSFEHSGISPDIVCLSKSLGGGLPFSINLIKPQSDLWNPGEHTGTFRGNNLAFVAGKAVLEHWQDDFEEKITIRSLMIQSRLKAIADKYQQHDLRYRGIGMVWGLDVAKGSIAKDIINEAFANGLLIESSGADDEVLKVMAALTIDLPILEKGLDIMENAIKKVLA
jgi:diaminobutyrate-2-oxoglutarate transaminase